MTDCRTPSRPRCRCEYGACKTLGPYERDVTRGAADEQRLGKTDWTRVEALTGEQALQNALADPDNPPLTDNQLARMRRVPDPQEIRQRLGLTQREFSQQFQIRAGDATRLGTGCPQT